MRTCDDRALESAIAAALRVAQRLRNGGSTVRRSVHAAPDRHVSQQDRTPHIAALSAAIFGRIEARSLAAALEIDRHAFNVGLVVVRSDRDRLASPMGYYRQSRGERRRSGHNLKAITFGSAGNRTGNTAGCFAPVAGNCAVQVVGTGA